jgi:hypothetical protein
MTIPQAKVNKEPTNVDPRKLVILAQTKVGKTELAMQLKGNLIIDLEDSTGFYKGPAEIYNLAEMHREFLAKNEAKPTFEAFTLRFLFNLVRKAQEEGPLCDYLTIDTTTMLQELAKIHAKKKYTDSPQGKNFKDDDITMLPMGLGYSYLRVSFKQLYNMLSVVARKGLILLAHPKDSSVILDGKELKAIDINLIGKLKQLVAADVDAIGVLYRDPKRPNVNVLSFKTTVRNEFCGSRSPHLSNQVIDISEKLEDDTLVANWDKIFLNIKK